ncbi:MAG: FkbM family methyltransferase [Pseudomonadota bacterium]
MEFTTVRVAAVKPSATGSPAPPLKLPELPGRIFENRFIAIKQCKHGIMCFNKNDLFVGKALDLYGEWCEREIELLGRFIRPGWVVVDVGANVGTHTIAFAGLVGPGGSVYAFEPQRMIFQLLCSNVALNALTNVMCLPFGISNVNGAALIPVINPYSQSNFGCLGIEGHQTGDGVRVTTLDSFNFGRCDMIKIDAEGLERKVLVGAEHLIRDRQPVIFVENNSEKESPAIIALLKNWGYRCWWHLAPYYNPDNFFGNPENVFPRVRNDASMLCLPREAEGPVEHLIPVEGMDDSRKRVLARLLKTGGVGSRS